MQIIYRVNGQPAAATRGEMAKDGKFVSNARPDAEVRLPAGSGGLSAPKEAFEDVVWRKWCCR
jgi:hypothetical protein